MCIENAVTCNLPHVSYHSLDEETHERANPPQAEDGSMGARDKSEAGA